MSAINCPKCRLTMPIIRDLAGRQVSCPECGCRFTMPPPAPLESAIPASALQSIPRPVRESIGNRNFLASACWVIATGGALLGAGCLMLAVVAAESAFQESALATIAIACAVIPYVIAKSVVEFARSIGKLAKEQHP